MDQIERKSCRLSKVPDNLRESFVDPTKEFSPPTPVLELRQNGQRYRFINKGEISLQKGKKKSKKTSFCICLAAATISLTENFAPLNRRGGPKNVLYIDTEQTKSDVARLTKTILGLAKIPYKYSEEFIHIHCLRKLNYKERIKRIDEILEFEGEKYSLLIIDGIRDLISSINDSEKAQHLMENLLKWTSEYDIHISCVLHENKSNSFSRGHIGTELENKSETIIRIKKQNDSYSSVECAASRGLPFNTFGLKLSNDKVPELVPTEEIYRYQKSKKRIRKKEVTEEDLAEILPKLKDKIDGIRHTECWKLLKQKLKEIGINIGNNKSKDLVNDLIEDKTLINNGSKKRMKLFFNEEKFKDS